MSHCLISAAHENTLVGMDNCVTPKLCGFDLFITQS